MKILHGKYGVEEVLDLRNVVHTGSVEDTVHDGETEGGRFFGW